MNLIRRSISSDQGQAVTILALMISVLLLTIIVGLNMKKGEHSRTYQRSRLLMQGLGVMRNFGPVVQRGYDLFKLYGAACTPDTVLVQIAAQNGFCLPKGQICVDSLCLDSTRVVSVGHDDSWLEADVREQNDNRLKAFFRSPFLQSIFDGRAHAQRITHRPPLPASGTTNNALGVIACPAGALCKVCNNTQADAAIAGNTQAVRCIRLRVCPAQIWGQTCTSETDYWAQRYAVRIN